ncbi:hypothetical protein [Flavobacterium sp.]|uniref:hypothetical protein n=1 Tax=Flavobacterium sp. TaxID=239 RepID=UPI00261ED919|nr:hypothetical protein [Flavobacterium sp.]
MKNLANRLIIIIAPFIFSCQNTKTTLENSSSLIALNSEGLCPEDGVCNTTVLKNQGLKIKLDEFNHLYYKTEASANTSVIRFEYKRKAPEGLQDGIYREEIVFEINNSDTKLELEDVLLKSTKMIYGRLCYCRGQTGYFLVNKGKLTLEKNQKEIKFNLDFTVSEVPQIIKKIVYPSK